MISNISSKLVVVLLVVAVVAALVSSTPSWAQATLEPRSYLSPSPSPSVKDVAIANSALWASTLLLARATKYGSEQCRKESIKEGRPELFGRVAWIGGQLHPYQHSFKASLPLDAGVTLLSILWRHRERAVWMPLLTAGVQAGIAGNQFAGGCY